MTRWEVALGAVLLCAMLACSGVKVITLSYRPVPNGPLAVAKAAPEITLNTFRDGRPDEELGKAQNYGGHVFFTVHTRSDVAAWATQALALELTRAGCKVKAGDHGEAPAGILINGTVQELSSLGIITTLRLTIQVVQNDKVLSSQAYTADAQGFKEKTFNTVYTTDYANLYEVALQNLLKQAVPQIISALDEPP